MNVTDVYITVTKDNIMVTDIYISVTDDIDGNCCVKNQWFYLLYLQKYAYVGNQLYSLLHFDANRSTQLYLVLYDPKK